MTTVLSEDKEKEPKVISMILLDVVQNLLTAQMILFRKRDLVSFVVRIVWPRWRYQMHDLARVLYSNQKDCEQAKDCTGDTIIIPMFIDVWSRRFSPSIDKLVIYHSNRERCVITCWAFLHRGTISLTPKAVGRGAKIILVVPGICSLRLLVAESIQWQLSDLAPLPLFALLQQIITQCRMCGIVDVHTDEIDSRWDYNIERWTNKINGQYYSAGLANISI